MDENRVKIYDINEHNFFKIEDEIYNKITQDFIKNKK